MKKIFLLCATAILLAATGFAQSEYVNPLVGTAEHGHTFPGALVPFGAVQVSPDTRLDGWDGCSGYHYTDNRIYGFSHTHLSGTGCSDYGDVLIMPFTGTPSIHNNEYSCTFSHKNEHANAGYYHVMLDNSIYVELTAGQRVAMHRYTFPKKGPRGIVINLTHRDKVLASGITINGNEIVGFRRSEAWNPDQYCAFSIIPSSPIQKIEFYKDDQLVKETDVRGENCKAIVYFSEKVRMVTLNVAISAVDIAGAMNNQNELRGKSIEQVEEEAVAAWDKELSKIQVESNNKEYLQTFYTALYHCFTSPYLYSDLDGRYRGQDGEIHESDGRHQIYTVFSLWDTYRALHPLLNIIDQKRTGDFLHTFMQHYRQGTMLPVWELSAYETWCMIGYHSVPVIWDAFIKGIRPYDVNEMLRAMRHSATLNKLGRPDYAKYGYIPGTSENESVSKTLEYCYDDWCIAQFAKEIGNQEVYDEYIARAQFYKNILDPDGFMHGKRNGAFATPFDPTEVNNFYTEANCWQYSTYVPHDVTDYVYLMGGDKAMGVFLDSLFHGDSKMTGREQSDITGVIGQYAHGNEPSHHAAYLYNFIGQPWKTQELTRKIMTELYTSQPDGLCGNEDCGQMSAWYVFSAMGFYPVCPGKNQYIIGYPLFDKTTVNLENGAKFVITRDKDLPYIQSVLYNGEPLNVSYITYNQIKDGGLLEFKMGDKPSETWGIGYQNTPKAIITPTVTTVPYFSTDQPSFTDSLTVSINLYQRNVPDAAPMSALTDIFYTLDGSTPAPTHGMKYTEPITLKGTTTLKAIAYNKVSGASKVAEATYRHFNKDKTVNYITMPSPQYFAGGQDGLIDEIHALANWRVGGWQGFQGDFEAIIDLHQSKPVHSVSASCLEDVRAWIFFPSKVEVLISDDGKQFRPFGTTNGIGSEKSEDAKLHSFTVNGNETGRYLKVKVYNYGKMPSWHISPGEQAWLFMDEITVK